MAVRYICRDFTPAADEINSHFGTRNFGICPANTELPSITPIKSERHKYKSSWETMTISRPPYLRLRAKIMIMAITTTASPAISAITPPDMPPPSSTAASSTAPSDSSAGTSSVCSSGCSSSVCSSAVSSDSSSEPSAAPSATVNPKSPFTR